MDRSEDTPDEQPPRPSVMTESWKGLLVISAVAILVPWYMSGFDPDALGYWVQVAFALILSGLIVSVPVNWVERRIGRLAATLLALMILPELVLFLHFYVLTAFFGLFE